MADEREQIHTGGAEAPEAGESIHLPGPSYLPVITAFGIACAIVGVVIFPVLTAIGVVIAAIAIWRWIGQTRTEMGELPLEHR